jgi:hypothetical protein
VDKDLGGRLWTWLVRTLALVLLALGLGILLMPDLAAPLFASPPSPGNDQTYQRAIALRDVAIGLWLMIGPSISRRATAASLGTVAVIPFGDLVLVALNRGSFIVFLPHVVSLIATLGLALWGRRLAER